MVKKRKDNLPVKPVSIGTFVTGLFLFVINVLAWENRAIVDIPFVSSRAFFTGLLPGAIGLILLTLGLVLMVIDYFSK